MAELDDRAQRGNRAKPSEGSSSGAPRVTD
jgi:hypothetical protein